MKLYHLVITALLFTSPKLAIAEDTTFEDVHKIRPGEILTIGDKDIEGRTTCNFDKLKVDPSLVVTVPKNSYVTVTFAPIKTSSGNYVLWTKMDLADGTQVKTCLYFRPDRVVGLRRAINDDRKLADSQPDPAAPSDAPAVIPESAITQTPPITINEWGLLIANCKPGDQAIDELGILAGRVKQVLSIALSK